MGEPPSREESRPPFTTSSSDDEPETSGSEQGHAGGGGGGGGAEDAHRPLPLRQQLVGACRADDRLRPLLTLNVSCSAAENRFISHLSQVNDATCLPPFRFSPHVPLVSHLLGPPVQHFEVSEVGMLARCLCVPLVSLRVGKVERHGPLLCPTAIR
jgi:hypothetical protein